MKWEATAKRTIQKLDCFPWFPLILITLIFCLFKIFLNSEKIPAGKGNVGDYLAGMGTPLLISFFFWAIIGFCCIVQYYCYLWATYLEEYDKREFRRWAIERLVLLKFSLITPVEYLSLKILKLEEGLLLYPATPMKLKLENDSLSGSEVSKVTEILLEPLIETLEKDKLGFIPYVFIKGDNECARENVTFALEKAFPKNDISRKIIFFDECPGFDIISEWIDHPIRELRLLIILELHTQDREDYFENGTAFVFSKDRNVTAHEFPLYLLRTITSNNFDLPNKLKIYFAARQLDINSHKNIWLSGFDKQTRHSFDSAINGVEGGTGPNDDIVSLKIANENRHEIEKVTGNQSAGQSWLTVALAAEATIAGQGNQIIAGFKKPDATVTMLARKNPGYWPDLYDICMLGFALPSSFSLALPFVIAAMNIFSGVIDSLFIWILLIIVVFGGIAALGIYIFTFFMDKIQHSMSVYPSRY